MCCGKCARKQRQFSTQSGMASNTPYEEIAADDRRLIMHAKVFAAGDKYGVQGLKDRAHYNFGSVLESANPLTAQIADAVRMVYVTTPEHVRDLRNVVCDALLKSSKNIAHAPEVEAAVRSIYNLAYALFKRCHAELAAPKVFRNAKRRRDLDSSSASASHQAAV
ncbi:hypothetical protein LTR37_015289 [Vermiconidia calcicola]|uniref:Uncharacterized protein n=1 Tax=Vermiconidia calcicola TaxID=1690605 RepID=A0ACC3MR29_9PEZI|nr:hypothetical protein LTR37_015289 [Vermiconidia calcicola]